MEYGEKIKALRLEAGLSQEALAGELFVTRQAVSRWENGETLPGLDSLKLLSARFGVSVDELLGTDAAQCQSCGMALNAPSQRGSMGDGELSPLYCSYCFQDGHFAKGIATVEDMVQHNLADLAEWNREMGLNLNREEAAEGLRTFLPTLKRWREES